MKIAFRVDSGNKIGCGHFMRCLYLGEYLYTRGYDIYFICRDHVNNFSKNLPTYFTVFLLKLKKNITLDPNEWLGDSILGDSKDTLHILQNNNINFLIVDHYSINYEWETIINNNNNITIFVIDDLANRKHNCDIILDYSCTDHNIYANFINNNCIKLFGFDYVILKDESKVNYNSDKINILVSFGGYDTTGETQKILDIINTDSKFKNFVFHFVLGHSDKYYELNKFSCDNLHFYQFINMWELLPKIKLAIGSVSTSLYERFYFGIPTIGKVIAENQTNLYKSLINKNCIIVPENWDNLFDNITYILDNLDFYHNNCKNIVDGKGKERIYNNIMLFDK